jgi:hypothetical protein
MIIKLVHKLKHKKQGGKGKHKVEKEGKEVQKSEAPL